MRNVRFPESEKSDMLDERERIEQEVVQAAIIHYQLGEAGHVSPVVQRLVLEEERKDFTSKFAVLVAGRAALVWRDHEGAYKVEDDPDRHLWESEDEEKEAYQVLLTAAHYLEVDVARLVNIEVQDLTRESGYFLTGRVNNAITPLRKSRDDGEHCANEMRCLFSLP